MILTDFVVNFVACWLTWFYWAFGVGTICLSRDLGILGKNGVFPDRFIIGIYALLVIPPAFGMTLAIIGSGWEIPIGVGICIAYGLVFWKAKVWETIEIASLVLHNSRTSSGTHENR